MRYINLRFTYLLLLTILQVSLRPHLLSANEGLDCSVRSHCQTCRRCSSKPDPPDLLQSSRRCPAITWLEARSRPTSHHMDPSDPPEYGNIGDWCSQAGRGQIVLPAIHSGGMLRLITSRHDDDDDDALYMAINVLTCLCN